METESVYDLIREKIVRNDIRPGSKINIDALVRELGVSQTPVREALHHLEGDGLVERVRGRGYSTTALLDGTEFRHMFEVRMLLEPWSARVLSSDRMTNTGEDLVSLVDDFRASGNVSRTHLAMHDELFHKTLQRATGNSFLFTAFDCRADIGVSGRRSPAHALLKSEARVADKALSCYLSYIRPIFHIGL